MMHHVRLLGTAKEQEGLPCLRLRERTARQRGVEQLGAPRRETLNLREYRTAMEGVYSTSVNERTIDEAPDAYKPIEDIIGPIADAVDIIDVMRPIYNFKAS